ncbi:hypothetical protein X736_32655 [Mesorhizobium sp. L2C089B000]|nr:hypothetical protein X736_32655 [Mesorhizobium sp. L2C089B000]ESZ29645.1 hypothetical protein X733_25715 [Mesorhizobium sp. L2C067A000]ESZ32944.1 hypothetical protein X731_31625 [Mesorhizobium sp. L2C054A000]
MMRVASAPLVPFDVHRDEEIEQADRRSAAAATIQPRCARNGAVNTLLVQYVRTGAAKIQHTRFWCARLERDPRDCTSKLSIMLGTQGQGGIAAALSAVS